MYLKKIFLYAEKPCPTFMCKFYFGTLLFVKIIVPFSFLPIHIIKIMDSLRPHGKNVNSVFLVQ